MWILGYSEASFLCPLWHNPSPVSPRPYSVTYPEDFEATPVWSSFISTVTGPSFQSF